MSHIIFCSISNVSVRPEAVYTVWELNLRVVMVVF